MEIGRFNIYSSATRKTTKINEENEEKLQFLNLPESQKHKKRERENCAEIANFKYK